MNFLSEKINRDERKFELVEKGKEEIYLGDLYIYYKNINELMIYLWEHPEYVFRIIKYSDKEELKNYLAPLFVNNFYENIVSSYYMENNLIYIITLLLQDEINGLTNRNIEEKFLENTACGYIFEELRKKRDIRSFFKNIIIEDLEELIVKISSSKFQFDKPNLNSYFGCEKIKNSQYDEKKKKEFIQKYFVPLDKKALQKVIEEYKSNKYMNDFLNKKIDDCQSNENIYSYHGLFSNMFKSEFSNEWLSKYINDFSLVIPFLNSILDKIEKNIHILPYSIKCIFRIISVLFMKKSNVLNKSKQIALLAKFFFGKLLIPILKNPEIEIYFDKLYIDENTKYNLKIICFILDKFTSGNFFESNRKDTENYTPFNWFFIEKMEKLFNIFNFMDKVKLPTFIDKIIHNKLPLDYEFNYFRENPDKTINHRSICFNLFQLKTILNTINKQRNEFFIYSKDNILKNILEKLIPLEVLILDKDQAESNIIPNSINKKAKNNEIQEKVPKKLYYYLISSLLINENNEKFCNINGNTKSFLLDEEKQVDNEILYQNILCQKIKKTIYDLLDNSKQLIKADFQENLNDIKYILNKLNLLMKFSNYYEQPDDSIPYEWYIKFILDYLEKINESFINNNYEKLFNEIKDDINKSNSNYLEVLSIIIKKLEIAKKRTILFQ